LAQNADMQNLLQEKADAMAADINQQLDEQTDQALQDLQERLEAEQAQSGEVQPTQPTQPQSVLDNNPATQGAAPTNAQLAPVAPAPSNVPSDVPLAAEGADDAFYDANDLVPAPQGEMSREGTTRPVDPRTEPASRMIIVREDHGKTSLEARLVAAERALKLGMPESALEIYEDLRLKYKKDPNVLHGLAMTQQKLGYTDRAIRTYEMLLDKYPDHVEARINMLGLMADLYPAVALRNLSDLMDEEPDNVAVMAQAAVIHARMGNYQEGLNLLGMAASLEPKNASHLFNMAVIADRGNNREKAIEFYEKALEVDTLYGSGSSIPRETIFGRLAQLR
jgi:tetratricopeptide (TPR) repeat protein